MSMESGKIEPIKPKEGLNWKGGYYEVGENLAFSKNLIENLTPEQLADNISKILQESIGEKYIADFPENIIKTEDVIALIYPNPQVSEPKQEQIEINVTSKAKEFIDKYKEALEEKLKEKFSQNKLKENEKYSIFRWDQNLDYYEQGTENINEKTLSLGGGFSNLVSNGKPKEKI